LNREFAAVLAEPIPTNNFLYIKILLETIMQILEIKNIIRKDVPIYYRRLYSGMVVMQMINKSVERKIDFSIETKPTGQKEILIP
jgi:hypothetical protein